MKQIKELFLKNLTKLTINLPQNIYSQLLVWQYLTKRRLQKHKNLPKYLRAKDADHSFFIKQNLTKLAANLLQNTYSQILVWQYLTKRRL